MHNSKENRALIKKIWRLAYAKGYMHAKEKPTYIGSFEQELDKFKHRNGVTLKLE